MLAADTQLARWSNDIVKRDRNGRVERSRDLRGIERSDRQKAKKVYVSYIGQMMMMMITTLQISVLNRL